MPTIIRKAIESVLQPLFVPAGAGGQSDRIEIALEATSLPSITKPNKKRKPSGHTRPRSPNITLDQAGRLRVANLLAILNVSHSTLYAGIRSGRYPSPDGRDGGMPFWNTATVKKFLES